MQVIRIMFNSVDVLQGCWGIAVDSGYASVESFQDVVIRCNTVKNVGNQFIGILPCHSTYHSFTNRLRHNSLRKLQNSEQPSHTRTR
jgi:hypothetical protein